MALYGDNPTDPIKKVTRGKTTTTTSTREGSVRGRTGTFTDTVETTPVNTNISGNNSGSEAFNSAFANARKQGLSNFDFGGKKYNTDMGSNTTSNESSTTTTFKPHKVTGVAQLNPSGIKFSKQSYEMGKTQDIQRPGADAMHVLAVGRNSPKGETRDYHLVQKSGDGSGYFQGKQAITQDMRVMTLSQKEDLIKNVDLHNKLLNDKYSEDAITTNITKNYGKTNDPKVEARRKKHLEAKIAEGQTRIKNNTAFYKVPK